jgi:hypothetical protein
MEAVFAKDMGGEGYEIVCYKIGRYALTADDFLANHETEVQIKLSDGRWFVEVDGSRVGSGHADNIIATQAAWAHVAENVSRRDEALFAHTGLSPDEWKIDGKVFKSIDDGKFWMFSGTNGWRVYTGNARIAEDVSIEDAVAAISACELLTPHQLGAMERLFEFPEGVLSYMTDRPQYDQLVELGFAATGDGGVKGLFFATEAGLIKLDADPRCLPLRLREIVFEGAEKVGFDGDARRAWNRFMGDRHHDNGTSLAHALRNGVELYVGMADNEPFEIAIRGEGRLVDGTYLSDQPIALLDPSWSADCAVSEKFAAAVVEQQALLREAINPAKATIAEVNVSP